ncbi:MAG: hypothetical protein SFY69_12885 [Planctomycetota bacterium]|nr:hypothetical protein [Planctomycetota bacterium]
MRTIAKAPARTLIWLGLAGLSLPACTGLEPAMVGVGVTAVETGATVLGRGKVGTYEIASVDDVEAAARTAASNMALTFIRERESDIGTVLTFRDDRRHTITVSIERQSRTVMFVRADVGLFGPTGLAALFIRQAQKELEAARATTPE